MLFSFFSTFKFTRFCQSGMYLDFFIKILVEKFTKNVLVYSANFFLEKFFIEYLTKIFLANFITN